MSHIFISYSHKDEAYVHELQQALLREGFEVWIDDRLEYGDEWPIVIQERLDACDAFILVATESSFRSRWVHKEVTRAERTNKPFFPLLLSGQPWLTIESTQYVDVRDRSLPPERFYAKLAIHTTRKKPAPHPPPADQEKLRVLRDQAAQLEASGDFWNALNVWNEIKHLDPHASQADSKIRELKRGMARRDRQKQWERVKTQSIQSVSVALRSIHLFFKSLVSKTPKGLAKYRAPVLIGSTGLFGIALLGILLLRPAALYYTAYENGKTEVYEYVPGQEPTKITHTLGAYDSWGAVLSFNTLFFTSNRDGKAEIYKFSDAKGSERITHTPGNYASWGPVPGFNVLYFTSNRDGRAEIYKFTESKGTERVTYTPGSFASWGPALGFNVLYFTSNRDGRAEIYKFTESKGTERITYTPERHASWGAVVSSNTLFFVSNRDGKAEIYKFTDASGTERVTYTPANFKSWGPMVRGQSLIFTSDRSGRAQLYQLSSDPTPILEGTAWTSFLVDQYPTPPNQ